MQKEPTYEQLQDRIKELEEASAEAKLVREALRKSEAKLRQLTEAAGDVGRHRRSRLRGTKTC